MNPKPQRESLWSSIRKRYLLLFLFVTLVSIVVYRAFSIWYHFKQITLHNFRLEEIRLITLDGSQELRGPPYGLDAKIHFENSKCPLNFDILGMNIIICTERRKLNNQSSKDSHENGTFISIGVDDLNFTKRTKFAFNARMKIKSFIFDRTVEELINSKYFIQVSVIIRARFCYVPFWFTKNIHANKLQITGKKKPSTSFDSFDTLDSFKLHEFLSIRIFNKYPVPCLQVGLRRNSISDFRLDVGCLKLEFVGFAKIIVFITSFDTNIFLTKEESNRQFEEDNKLGGTIAFHENIPGEFDEDGVTFFFMTIPLFQNLSIVKFMTMLENEVETSKIFSLDSVSVLSCYKITGITPPLRDFMTQEQQRYLRALEEPEKNKEQSDATNEKLNTYIHHVNTGYCSRPLPLEIAKYLVKEVDLSQENVSNEMVHTTESRQAESGKKTIVDDKNANISTQQSNLINEQQVHVDYSFAHEPPQVLSEEQLLIKLFNNPKLMHFFRTKFSILKSIDSENIQKSLLLNFSYLKDSTVKIFEKPKDSTLLLKNFGFVDIRTFSKVPILNYSKKNSKTQKIPPVLTRGSIIHIKNFEFKSDQCSFTVGFSQESKFRIFLLRLCKIKTFGELINKLSLSFDVFLGKDIHWATGLFEFIVDEKIREEDDSDDDQEDDVKGSNKDPLDRGIHSLIKFTFKKHSNESITPFNISKLKFSFFKFLHNRKTFADLDLFHLAIDYPNSIYIFDNFGNRAVVYKFGMKKQPFFSILLAHLVKGTPNDDFVKVETKIDCSRLFTPLNNLESRKFLIELSHLVIDVPKIHATVITPQFKIRSEVRESQMKISRVSYPDSSLFDGVMTVDSSVMFKSKWSYSKTFISMLMDGHIVFSLCDGLFTFECSPNEFVSLNQLNKSASDTKKTLENSQKPFFRVIPLSFKFDSENTGYNSLLSPCLKVSHVLEEGDKFESFSLFSNPLFRKVHEIVSNPKDKIIDNKPFTFHIRNTVAVEDIGYPVDFNSYSCLNLKSKDASCVIDVTSIGGCFYFLDPIRVRITLPSLNDTIESFTDKSYSECPLHSALKMIENIIADILKPNQSDSIECINKNEEINKKPLEAGAKETNSNGIPDFKIILNSDNPDSIFCSINVKIPKTVINMIPFVHIDPTINVSLSSVNEKDLKIFFDVKKESDQFSIAAEFSLKRTLDRELELITKVNGKIVSRCHAGASFKGTGESKSSPCPFKPFEIKEILLRYLKFFSSAFKSSPRATKNINYNDPLLISSFVPDEEQLPVEFQIAEDDVPVISAESTSSIKSEPAIQTLNPPVMKVKVDKISGTSNSFGLDFSLGINAVLEDLGVLLGNYLAKIPLIQLPSYFNLSLNCTNSFQVKINDTQSTLFTFKLNGLNSVTKLKVPLLKNDKVTPKNLSSSVSKELNRECLLPVKSDAISGIPVNQENLPKNLDPIMQSKCPLPSELHKLLLPVPIDNESFVELSAILNSDNVFAVTEKILRNFSQINFVPSFPIDMLLDIFKEIKSEGTESFPQYFRVRMGVDYLPCAYLDIKSPYTVEFIGDEFIIFLDPGETSKAVFRFRNKMFDSSVMNDGFQITIPIFLLHFRDTLTSNTREFLPMNINEKTESAIVRSFLIHKNVKFSYNFALLSNRTFKTALMCIEYFTRLKTDNKLVFYFFSQFVRSLLYLFRDYAALKQIVYCSYLPVSKDFGDQFNTLSDMERHIIIECLQNSPRIVIPTNS